MKKYLFLITVLYFLLGFLNIILALAGLLCMLIPFALLYKSKRKVWCQHYCPRANLFTRIGKLYAKGKNTPKSFTKGPVKWVILAYFGFSLFVIMMTTIRVSMGLMAPMYYLRFLIAFPIPLDFPQLLSFEHAAPWLLHLGYRFYSMMLTTTLLGAAMAVIYKPRTWCTVCPIATMSQVYLDSSKKQKSCCGSQT